MEPAIPGMLLADRYHLVRPLGSGGTATVWEAVDVTRDQPVAVKLLRGAAVHNPTERERLRREARVLARLEHPRICAIHDYFELQSPDDSPLPVLVTELLTGTSLAQRLKQGPLPWGEAVTVAAQVADALLAAHHAGVVHRDVKPANVMLVPGGAKLLDFGVARGAGDGDLTGNLTVGTPLCMAPEQVRGQRAKPASDIYALGCVLYWALTGHPPYQSNDITEVFQAQLYAPPPPIDVPGLPARVIEFCEACLSKNPLFRPNAAQVLTTLSGISSAAGFKVTENPGYIGRRSLAQFRPVAVSNPGENAVSTQTLEPEEPEEREEPDEERAAALPAGQAADDALQGTAPDRQTVAPAAFDGTTPTAIKAGRHSADRAADAGGHDTAGRRRHRTRPLVLTAAGGVGLGVAAVLALVLTGNHPASSAYSGAAGGSRVPIGAPSPTAPAGDRTPSRPLRISSGTASPLSVSAAADPIRYLEAVRAQIRGYIADGPATIDPVTGGDLQNSIIDIENSVIAAQRNGGQAHLQEIRSKIAAFDGRVGRLAGEQRISRPAANQLTEEVLRLSGGVTD